MKRIALLAIGLLALVGCKPSPERFSLTAHGDQELAGESGAHATSLGEGNLVLIRAEPLDGGHDPMDLCVTAVSSNPSAVEVRRVRGQCRSFIVMARTSGTATLTFEAREHREALSVTVPPLAE
ncbi:MAG TPA: hypothetical protein VM925_08995 [Labilithrix sp.]|nr:hypothetical protein [Labilithrix sp.]